jgi:hypothetical protein
MSPPIWKRAVFRKPYRSTLIPHEPLDDLALMVRQRGPLRVGGAMTGTCVELTVLGSGLWHLFQPLQV